MAEESLALPGGATYVGGTSGLDLSQHSLNAFMNSPHWPKVTTAVVFGVLVSAQCLSSAHSQSWPEAHHDPSRSGRAEASGQITEPAVKWSMPLGGRAGSTTTLVHDVCGATEQIASGGGAIQARGADDTLRWTTGPLGTAYLSFSPDLDGDGRPEVVAAGARLSVIDPCSGEVRWQLAEEGVSYSAGFTTAPNGASRMLLTSLSPSRLRVIDFSAGFDAADVVYSVEDPALPLRDLLTVVGDFDGDGIRQEMASSVRGVCALALFDMGPEGGTEVTPTLVPATNRRCLGLLQAENIDDDPQDEVIVTSDLGGNGSAVSITAYDFVDGQVQWQYVFGTGTDVFTAPLLGAVGDLDGDGRREVVYAVYNNGAEAAGADDGVEAPDRWVTVVVDAATGAPLAHALDRVPAGILDVDGDGADELVLQVASAGTFALPAQGPLEVVGLDADRALAVRRSLDSASLVWRRGPTDRMRSRYRGTVPTAVPTTEGRGLLVTMPDVSGQGTRLMAQSVSQGGGQLASFAAEARSDFTVLGSMLATSELVAADALGHIYVFDDALTPSTTLPARGFLPSVLGASPAGFGTSLLLLVDSSNNLVVANPGAADALHPPTAQWTISSWTPGRRFAFRWLPDVFGVVFTGTTAGGHGFIEVRTTDGASVWRRDVETARAPVCRAWGALSGGAASDLVCVVTEGGGTSSLRVFDGDTGAEVVRRSMNYASIYSVKVIDDQDGDGGADLLLLLNTRTLTVSGVDLVNIEPTWNWPMSGFALPTHSAIIDLDGDDTDSVFLNLTFGGKAVVTPTEGAVGWSREAPPSLDGYNAGFPGFSDVDVDGVLDIAVPGSLGDLTVYSGATGSVLHRLCLVDGGAMPLDAPASGDSCSPFARLSSVAVGDIDGDMDEDYVVSDAAGWLYAVDAFTGALTWSLNLRSTAGDPVLMNIDEDTAVEVVVGTVGAGVVAVDQAELRAPSEVRDVAVVGGVAFEPGTDIDVSVIQDKFAVAWDSVNGAVTYLLTLFSDDGLQIFPWTNVGPSTTYVREGLTLSPGTRYHAAVVALHADLGASAVTESDGVLIAEPQVIALTAAPNPFNPSANHTTTFTGHVQAANGQALDLVELTVTAPAGELVLDRTFQPRGAEGLPVEVVWEGLDSAGGTLADGVYRATLSAVDGIGATSGASTDVEIVSGPKIREFNALPSAFSPDAGETTEFAATIESSRPLVRATFAIAGTSVDIGLAPGPLMTYTWDGLEGGAPVAPGDYWAELTVVDDLGAEASASVNVTVSAAVFTISDFVASPPAFINDGQGSTTFGGHVVYPGHLVTVVTLEVERAGVVTRLQTWQPLSERVDISEIWNGFDDGTAHDAGVYEATLCAHDAEGEFLCANTDVTLLGRDDDPLAGGDRSHSQGTRQGSGTGDDGCCACSVSRAQPRTPGAAALFGLLGLAGLLAMRRRR